MILVYFFLVLHFNILCDLKDSNLFLLLTIIFPGYVILKLSSSLICELFNFQKIPVAKSVLLKFMTKYLHEFAPPFDV